MNINRSTKAQLTTKTPLFGRCCYKPFFFTKLNKMTNYDVVKKLIGDVRPKGDASIDYEILENLKALCELHAEIHKAIDDVAYDFRNDKQGSVKMCCDEAYKYFDSLGISD